MTEGVALLAQQTVDDSLAWYAYPFWAMVFASLGYWIYRAYQRFTRGKQDGAQVVRADSPGPPPPTGTPSRPSSPTTTVIPPERASPATGAAQPPVTRFDRSKEQSTTGGRSGLFAPAEPSTPAAPRPPVARLLQGITMPCGLAPVLPSQSSPSSRFGLQVCFATSGVEASEVGRALGDELERLGFSVASLNDSQVEATRDEARVLVSIVTDPAERKVDGLRMYPSLPPESIVVEFESL